MVTILACKSKQELKQFEQVPELLLRENPCYVPPFPGSISKIFDKKGPFERHGELFPFIAYRNGIPVGRIAAVVNRTHNLYYKDTTGFFGFFDCIDDSEVANELFRTASKVLSEKGLSTIRGPYSPSVNDECGLLVDGFSSPPMVMMPFNPEYYEKLLTGQGLNRVRDLFAFYMSAETTAPEKIIRIAERVKKATGVSVRPLNLKKLDHDLKIIQKLYNQTLDRNWGFVPITFEDLQYAANDLKAIVDPELVMLAEKDGVPAGFSMVIPNINEFMAKAKHSSRLMRILKFIWYLKTSKPKEARLAVLGVAPEFRNKGLAALFYVETLLKGGKKFSGGELSWVEESNDEMIRAISLMGGKQYKTYRIYEKPIAL